MYLWFDGVRRTRRTIHELFFFLQEKKKRRHDKVDVGWRVREKKRVNITTGN